MEIKNIKRFKYNSSSSQKKKKTFAEIRIEKDIEEFNKNENIGKFCKIKIFGFEKEENLNRYKLYADFDNHFRILIIFKDDYPYSPPVMTFYSGNKYPFLFNSNFEINFEDLKEEKWNPTISLSTLLYKIELSISNEYNKIYHHSDIQKYGKRKWKDYLKNENSFVNDINYFCSFHTIKKLKIIQL